jgi:hypothetical protein
MKMHRPQTPTAPSVKVPKVRRHRDTLTAHWIRGLVVHSHPALAVDVDNVANVSPAVRTGEDVHNGVANIGLAVSVGQHLTP